MTTIVINAISIREGGSLVVLRELLIKMVAIRPEWQWVVVVHSKAKELLPVLPSVKYKIFPEIEEQAWRVRLWYEFGLPRFLKQVSAKLLFYHTNYLPLRSMPCRTLLLVQHAGHFSSVFRQLTEQNTSVIRKLAWRLKGRWVRSSVCRADMVTVQTKTLASRIMHETGCSLDHVRVVAHGCGQCQHHALAAVPPVADEPIRVGYITKAGVQKNFITLFRAVKILKDKGIRLKLVLTLSEDLADNRLTLALAGQYGITDLIENHGELSVEAVDQHYRTLHLFVFPSLCESFGFPMVEAMAYGIPLLVADVDSNIEVAGAGAGAFPAYDQNALALEIECLASDTDLFKQRAVASLTRSIDFNWSNAATGTLSLMNEVMDEDKDSIF